MYLEVKVRFISHSIRMTPCMLQLLGGFVTSTETYHLILAPCLNEWRLFLRDSLGGPQWPSLLLNHSTCCAAMLPLPPSSKPLMWLLLHYLESQRNLTLFSLRAIGKSSVSPRKPKVTTAVVHVCHVFSLVSRIKCWQNHWWAQTCTHPAYRIVISIKSFISR